MNPIIKPSLLKPILLITALILVGIAMLFWSGDRFFKKPPLALFTSSNDKYGLSVEFFGQWAGPDGDEKSQFVVDRISLRKKDTSAQVDYAPLNPEGLRTPNGTFREVWSPDGEYLVLPRGRLEGWAIFASGKAFRSLTNTKTPEWLAVRYAGKPDSVWHNFTGWTGNHVLVFDAEIENLRIKFSYDLRQKQLSAAVPSIAVLTAWNEVGPVAISWQKQP